MAIVGTAEVLVLANDKDFERSLRAGAAPGLAGFKSDVGKAGDDAGKDLAKRAEKGGADAGMGLRNGLKRSLSGLGGLLGGIGLDLGPLTQSLDASAQKLDKVDRPANGLKNSIASLGRTTAIVGGAAFLAFAAGSVKMGNDFQTATAQMAANANIPVQAATAIGKAFTTEGGNVVYSANEQMAAFGQVAGQLAAVQGHALTTKDAVGFMKTSMDLAEESGQNLASTTSDLSQVMQTFQIPLKDSGSAADTLFNASRITNVSLDSLTQTADRLKARLGVTAPTIQDLSSFMVDLAEHGVTGSRGLLVVNTAINTLLTSTTKLDAAQQAQATKSAKAVQTAQDGVAKATLALQTAEDKAAASTGKSASAQQAAADAVSKAKLALADAQKKLSDAEKSGSQIQNANVAAAAQMGIKVYDATGKFVGMRDVIAQLQPKLAGMTQQQQLQALTALFGSSANKALLDLVLAGPQAYDKASKTVTDHAAAQHALQAQQQTLNHEMEAAKVAVENLATRFGLVLLPAVKDILSGFTSFLGFLEAHKPILYTFAAVIGTVLVAAIGVWIYTVGEKMVASTKHAIDGISNLFKHGKDQASQAKSDALTNEQSAQRTENAFKTAAQQMQTAAEQMQRAASQIEAAFSQVGASATEMATQISTATGEVDAAVSGMTATTEGDLATADAAWAELGTAAEASAAEVDTAAAQIEADDAAIAEANAGAAGGKLGGIGGKLGGAAAVVGAGVMAYQATSSLLGDPNHPTSTAGKAVASATTAVSNFLGVGPQQTYQSTVGSGLSGNSGEIQLLEARAASPTGGSLPSNISPSDAKSMLKNLGVPGYDLGGPVPGAPGAPMLAMLHGGEFVFSRDMVSKMTGGKSAFGLAQALAAFSTSHSQTPSRFETTPAPVDPIRQRAKSMHFQEGAFKMYFNTPMSAPAVANEVGWALRVAATR